MKILVVDDDESVRKTIEEILTAGGHSIIQAKDGLEAMKLLKENEVDFIVSDWSMPGMSGIDFLKTVRGQEETKDIPFLICTSPSSDEVLKIEAAIGAKVDAYIVKPFRSDTLYQKISEVLSKKSKSIDPSSGILVVDDDDQVRKLIIEILELLGRGPHFEARDGVEGFQLLEAHATEIGLVLCDWEMPKMSGIDLLKKIRSDKRFQKLPFLMITSQTSIEHVKLKDAINAQVSHYLMKPFKAEELRNKMDLVLKRSRNERELEQLLEQARLLVQDDRVLDSREIYRDLIHRDPKNIAAHLELAETYLRDKPDQSFDEAVVLIKQVIQIAPGSDTGYIALALAFEHAKSLDKALQVLEEAAKHAQVQASENIHYHLGRLYLRKGRTDRALDHLNQALTIRPLFREAKELLNRAMKAED